MELIVRTGFQSSLENRSVSTNIRYSASTSQLNDTVIQHRSYTYSAAITIANIRNCHQRMKKLAATYVYWYKKFLRCSNHASAIVQNSIYNCTQSENILGHSQQV